MSVRPLLIGLFATTALAAFGSQALADPSGRVGRVAYLEGGVSLRSPGYDDWGWASRNYPVAPGESFWTGDDGRAQLQIGSVDARVDSETELDVVDLRYGGMRLALPQGSVDIRLWASPRGGVTISTPAGDVRLDYRGLYRIDVGAPQEDGSYPPVEVTVFEGEAGAPAPDGLAAVQAGEAAVIYAGYDPQIQDAQDASIDDWARDREARTRWRPGPDDAAAVTGFGDLYAAGDFFQDPQYGQVWFPRDVPADWAPYRYGHWSYVEPWGYTWIDDQPWGFAPFHYGRWTQIDGRWGWIPGRQTAEPVYAPALVAFIGGVGWNLGGSEAIGWVPLAPDEVYRPSYEASPDYFRRVNVTSVRTTIINSVTYATTTDNNTTINAAPVATYRNASAVTVVRAAAFSGAQPVHRALIPVTAAVVAAAPVAVIANRPPPTALARVAAPARSYAAGRPEGAPSAAIRPPAALAAVRSAVVAPPPAPGRPPVIVGARIAPPAQRPNQAGGQPAPLLIAPAQIRHPAAQGLASIPRPALQNTGQTRPGQAPPSAHFVPLMGRSGAGEGPVQGQPGPAPAAAQAEQQGQAQMRAMQLRDAQAQAAQAQARAQSDARAQADQDRLARAREAAQSQQAAAQAEAAQIRAAQAEARARAQDAQARAQAAQAQADQARQAQARDAQVREAQARDAQAREAALQAARADAARVQAEQASQRGRQAEAQAHATAAGDAAKAKPKPKAEPDTGAPPQR